MFFDLPPAPKLWVPPKPAIIRPAPEKLLRPDLLLPLFLGSGSSFQSMLMVSGSLPSFSFVTSGEGSTTTCTIPGTPTAGDLCIIWVGCRNSSTYALPSGFTEIARVGDGGATNGAAYIFAKKLVGSETTVTVPSGSNNNIWIAATFTPTSSWTTINQGTPNGEATSGNPVNQTVTVASVNPPVFVLGCMFSSGGLTPSTSPAMTEIAHSGARLYAHYLIYNPGSSPANQTTYDMGDGGAQNAMVSNYINLT